MQNESITYSTSTTQADGKDSDLWIIAKRRAAFKISAFTYAMVNCMLIAIWYMTSGPGSYFWPVWAMLGSGIGLATQYYHAYHGAGMFSVQKEYEKLKNQQQ